MIGQVVSQENSQRRDVVVVKPCRRARDVGTQHGDTLHRVHAFQCRHGRTRNRLLHEHDIESIGQARQQVLRTLINEVPPQMRESNKRGHVGSLKRL